MTDLPLSESINFTKECEICWEDPRTQVVYFIGHFKEPLLWVIEGTTKIEMCDDCLDRLRRSPEWNARIVSVEKLPLKKKMAL